MSYKILYDNPKKEEGTGIILFQIEAVIDMPHMYVAKGDLGGWIQFETNLSKTGNAWIDLDSTVSGQSKVIAGEVLNSYISGDCVVDGGVIRNSRIYGESIIKDATIQGSRLSGECSIGTDVFIFNSKLHNIKAHGEVLISDCMMVNFELIPEGEQAQHFKHVTCVSTDCITLKSRQHWERVELKASKFQIEGELDFSDSTIDIMSFSVFGNAEIKHLVTENDIMRLSIQTSENTSYLCGIGTESPLRIKTNFLHVENSMIVGSILLEGNLKLIDSVVQDFSKISMTGSLFQSSLKEFAVIDMESVQLTNFSVRLSGDSVLDEITYSELQK